MYIQQQHVTQQRIEFNGVILFSDPSLVFISFNWLNNLSVIRARAPVCTVL